MTAQAHRSASLDILRVLACAMVVAMHSPMPSAYAEGTFLVALSYLTAPCIGLFFMVSGALLLPVKGEMTAFLRRRFGRILVPVLLWTLFYVCLRLWFSEDEIDIARALLSVPFSPQGNGVLWFMYALTGLYLLAPVISPWLERCRERDIRLVLLLWGMTLLWPLLENRIDIRQDNTGMLYYFSGYGGYFLLGYYLRRWPAALPGKLLWPLCAVALCAPFVYKVCGIECDFYRVFWYLSVFVAVMAAGIFKGITALCRLTHVRESALAAQLSKCTFGIYLCHIFVMRYVLWKLPFIAGMESYVLQTVTVFALTFTLSWVLTWAMSWLPFSSWIIGCHNARLKP